MSLLNEYKINNLLKDWPQGVVFLTSWLTKHGYSNQLLNRYKKSHWIESIGTGALKRADDEIDIEGGLYALQSQAGSKIHIGAKSALSILGKAHYLELHNRKVTLFGSHRETLPSWMLSYSWDVEIDYHSSSFLPCDLGLVEREHKGFSILISGPIRAFMECLYLASTDEELLECYEIMEGLNSLRPKAVQQLLEVCTSVKVKRLFLYMAEKAKHSWVDYLQLTEVDLGEGNRSLAKNGMYISKYRITVSKELNDYAGI